MPTYSHSRLSTFEQCPKKYWFGYIEKVEVEQGTSIEAFMGSLVHEALEKLYKDLQFLKSCTVQEIVDFYNGRWEKEYDPDAVYIVRTEYKEENYRRMGERFIRDYYARHQPFTQAKTIGLETQWMAPIDDAGEYQMHIRIDRLALDGETFEIHDYKTSNTLPTQDKADTDRQLALYAYGLKRKFPWAKRIRLIWHYLAFDKDIESERSDEQLELLKAEIMRVIRQVESTTEFEPRQSPLCNWCEFQRLCPLWKHKFATDALPPEEFRKEDGVKLVNEFARLKEQERDVAIKIEEATQRLVAFAKQQGIQNVFGSGRRAAIRTYPKLSFPKKEDPRRAEFFRTMKVVGLWDQLAVPDVYELAKMLNEGQVHDDVKRLLEPFIEKGTTTRIYINSY